MTDSDPKSKNTNIELLDCELGSNDGTSEDYADYRFLVDGRFIKYVMVASGTLSADNCHRGCEGILLGSLLPPFPPGDWNQGYVDKDSETGEVKFITTEKLDLPSVQNVWHPVKINQLDFAKEQLKCRIFIGTNPDFQLGQRVLLKFAIWQHEIEYMEKETTIYEYLHETGIGPGFLGHLTDDENGRVVGIVIEWVPDARPAELRDLEGCRMALKRLHEVGIKLGDTNRYNFLVREGHDVVIVDFETAEKCSSEEELDAEMNGLEASLVDTRFFGGYIPSDEMGTGN